MDIFGEQFVINASSIRSYAECPCCGKRSYSVHSYRPRKIQCTELLGHSVTMILESRHFRCKNPECGRIIFAEPLEMASPYMRTTHEVHDRIVHESVNQTARSAVITLSAQHIRTSPSTCHRILRKLGANNPDVHTSGFVGIDDFAKKRGHVYGCTIVDHYTRDVLAVFDTRYGNEIASWLMAHPEIRLVSRDGCRTYASIISEALPDAIQVSDRFHLIKNMKDAAVELIKGLLGRKPVKMAHPYPTEQEAYGLILEDMLSMGVEKHRTKVQNYYKARHLKDEGKSVPQIAEALSLKSTKVYKILNTDMSRILSPEQKKVMSAAKDMAEIISAGVITPDAIFKRLDKPIPPTLVCRCTLSIRKKYSGLRAKVREYNRKHKEQKAVKVSSSSIWNYIKTGKTESKKLLMLKNTHPLVGKVINVCIRFCDMIHAREGAPDVDTWIKEAEECECKQLTSFSEYIRKDRDAIEQAYLTYFSNALLEGEVNRTKAIKRQMFNRAGIQVLRTKMIYQGRNDALRWNQLHLN